MQKKFFLTSASLITLGSILLGGTVAPARAMSDRERDEAYRELTAARSASATRALDAERAREAEAAKSRTQLRDGVLLAAAGTAATLAVTWVYKKLTKE